MPDDVATLAKIVLAAELLLGLFISAGAQWTTVRIMDGFNERNTFGTALGFMTIVNAVALGAFLVPVVIGKVLGFGVVLVVLLGINFRGYELSLVKSMVAIPIFCIVTAVLNVLVIGGLAFGVGASGLANSQKTADVLEETTRLQLEMLGAAAPADGQILDGLPAVREPEATPRQQPARERDSGGVKAVEGMPGHYSYKDKRGQTHIVDSFDKVPEEYRY